MAPATNNVNTPITKTSFRGYHLNRFNKITINLEYSCLVYPLSDLEYDALKNSIKEDGLHYPLIVNPKGEILDGHHRYKICKELGIIPQIKHEIKYFNDSIEEKKFVIDINLKRRHLNDFQKAELAYKLEDIKRGEARQRQIQFAGIRSNNTLVPNDTKVKDEDKGRVIDIISKQCDLSSMTYHRARTIIENASENVKEQLRNKKTSISKEYQKIKRDKKRQELFSKINSTENNNNGFNNNDSCKIYHGDFIELQNEILEDNSIDLIFTDPPYGKESLFLYEELAKLATRVLKPGGSLVFFVGHIILDDVFHIFHNHKSELKYWWTFAVKHSGHHQKIYPRHVFATWKPMLWYAKGEKINELVISNTIGDYIESTSPSKALHDWEQSTVEAEHIIKNLTIVENQQIVLDPMMGTGTTGIVAFKKLNRKFIGIENDEETFKIAKVRIMTNNCYNHSSIQQQEPNSFATSNILRREKCNK